MSLIALLLLLFAVAAVGFVVARNVRSPAPANAEHPTCGQCGYIVRGLEGFICPECGSDLREVGIIPPGRRRPLGRLARLVIWTFSAAPAGHFLGLILIPLIAPTDLTATRRRVIFIQSPTINQTISVEQAGRQRVFGRPRINATTTVPMQTTTLDLGPGSLSTVATVDVRRRTAQFTDATGRKTEGPFDAEFVTAWLNVNGHNDGTVGDRAADIVAAVTEMDTPPGRGGMSFSRFAPNPTRGGIPDVTAHPASPPFIVPRNTPYANALPSTTAGAIWLLGLPFVLRRRHGTARVESPRDANEA